ncbi:DUF819 domain-containing protein [candidate division KSB1 bacterium]
MTETALLNEPTTVGVALVVAVGLIFFMADRRGLAGLFRYVPPITWAYFIPMIATTVGILPGSSTAYTWITHNLLPASLILLIMTTDVRAILRLGAKAIGMMLAGTAGIVIGGPVVLFLFGRWLPPDAWKGLGALAGSWIGGSVNMMAVAEGVGTPAGLLAPLIVVDTVVGYSWFGLLISLSAFQTALDGRFGFNRGVLDDLNRRLDVFRRERSRPVTIRDLAYMLAVAFGLGRLCLWCGDRLPELGRVVGPFTWTIILVTAVGLGLSFTRLRWLEDAGASRLGYIGIYIILASIGARANLTAVLDVPVFILAGIVWILIHALFLAVACWFLRAPVFFFATGSMANIGGTSTGPIIASVYQSALAPVGLLMAVLGMIIGTYAALACTFLMSIVAGI